MRNVWLVLSVLWVAVAIANALSDHDSHANSNTTALQRAGPATNHAFTRHSRKTTKNGEIVIAMVHGSCQVQRSIQNKITAVLDPD